MVDSLRAVFNWFDSNYYKKLDFFDMSVFSKKSLIVKAELHPLLQMVLDEAIESPPFDFGLHEGQRSLERQKALYDEGKSQIDGISCRGYHNYKPSLAFDFHCAIRGHTWDPIHLEKIARHIQAVAKRRFNMSLQWGGDWKRFKDYPHLQMSKSFKDKAEQLELY